MQRKVPLLLLAHRGSSTQDLEQARDKSPPFSTNTATQQLVDDRLKLAQGRKDGSVTDILPSTRVDRNTLES